MNEGWLVGSFCRLGFSFIERSGIRDRAVRRLAELIHDSDLETICSAFE